MSPSVADTLIIRQALELLTPSGPEPSTAKQLLGPVGPAPHLAQDPSFAELASLAISNDLLNSKEDVFTIGLSPFLFSSLVQPAVLEDNITYNNSLNTLLRRIGGSISMGGKGEFAPSDSAGKPLPVPEADDLRDRVNWELTIRVWGTRDLKELGALRHLKRLDMTKLAKRSADHAAIYDLLRQHASFVDSGKTYLDGTLVPKVLAGPAMRPLLKRYAESEVILTKAVRQMRSEAKGALVIALVVGQTNQRAQFGPKRWRAGVSAAKGFGSWNGTVSIRQLWTMGRTSGVDTTGTEFGGKLTYPILKGALGFEKGLPLSLEYGATVVEPSPKGGFASIHSFLCSLELPFTAAAKATVSLGWSNHADLLTKSDALFGRAGLAFDFSELFKTDKKED